MKAPDREDLLKVATGVTNPSARLQDVLDAGQRQRRIAAIGAAVLLVFGWFLFWVAVEIASLIVGLLGGAAVALGLHLVNGIVKRRLDPEWIKAIVSDGEPSSGGSDFGKGGPCRWLRPLLFGAGLLALGVVVLAVGNVFDSPFVVAAGVVVTGTSGGPFSLLLVYWSDQIGRKWVLTGLVGVLVGWLASLLPGGWRLAAVPIVIVGLVAYQLGLREECHRVGDEDPPTFVSRLCGVRMAVAVILAGCLLIIIGLWRRWTPIGVLGGLVVVTGAMALSAGLRGRAREPIDDQFAQLWRTLGVLGAALSVIAGYQIWRSGATSNSTLAVMAIVLVLVLVGASLVWRGETLYFFTLIGFAVVFGMINPTASDSASTSGFEPGAFETREVVAFGDSWISGEGAPRYFDGTDQKGNDRNECRRAPTAYSVLIAAAGVGGELDFYACSGADIDDVIEPSGDVRKTSSCRSEDGEPKGQYPCSPTEVYGRHLQIDNLLVDPTDPSLGKKDTSKTRLVLVSIGGNDVGFGQIVRGCLLPGSCIERREVWLDNVQVLGPALEQVYTEIKDAFDGRVPVVVMPYPLVVAERSCGSSPLESSEHAFIVEFTTVLNEQLKVAAERAGVHFFEEGMFAFEGHRVCQARPRAVNLIQLQASSGDFLERINPGSWTHNSMHPNSLGHELTHRQLADWLEAESILDGENPQPNSEASLDILGVRSLRPFPVDTADLLGDGVAETIRELGCDIDELDGFATQVLIFDVPKDDENPWWPVPLSGASDETAVCFTDADGVWRSALPGSGPVSSTVYIEADEVFLQGRPPASADADDVGWVVFQARPTGGAETGRWEHRAIRYCSIAEGCDASFADWSDTQIDNAVGQIQLPVALTLVGGFLFALGWSLAISPAVVAFLRRSAGS